MKQFFKDLNEKIDLIALLYLAFGIVLVLWPTTSNTLISYIFSGVCILYGMLFLYRYYVKTNKGFKHYANCLIGIISAGIGLFTLIKSDIVLSILPFVFGLALLIDFIFNMKESFDLYNKKYPAWKITMILSLVKLGLAIVMFYDPFDNAKALTIFIGLSLVYNGITNLWIGACFRKEPLYIEENAEDNEETEIIEETEVIEDPEIIDDKAN